MTPSDIRSMINEALGPLKTKIANSIARAVVKAVDDGRQMQNLLLEVSKDELVPDCEHFQGYGFASHSFPGAECVVVFPNGDGGHPLVIGVDDRRYRPTGLKRGEVAIYNKAGATVVLTEDGDIIATPAEDRKIKLGGKDADDPVARASDIAAVKAAITAGVPFSGTGDSGAALQETILAAWPASVGASKVDAE